MHVLEITTVGGSAGIILNKEVMAHWGYGKAIPSVSPRQRRDSEAYEAKLGRDGKYHGYRLGDDDADMRDWILEEWQKRGQ